MSTELRIKFYIYLSRLKNMNVLLTTMGLTAVVIVVDFWNKIIISI